LINTSLVRI